MLTVEQAHAMGKKGSLYSEHERLLYEAYCKGHCWAVGQWLEGKGTYEDITDRIRFAMWRDRGALEAAVTADARALVKMLMDALEQADADSQEVLGNYRQLYSERYRPERLQWQEGVVAVNAKAITAARAWLGEAQKGDGHHGT